MPRIAPLATAPATPAPPVTPPALLRRAAVRLANNGPLLRRLSGPLLRFAPIVRVGQVVLVTRHADVVEVLERDSDFTVAESNAASMDRVNGPFVLGMDRSPLCEREQAILARCVHDGDDARIRGAVRATAAELLEGARPRGRLDVVQDLARPAAVRLVADYFGAPGPDEATMATWMRRIFHETFLNIGGDAGVRRAGEASGASLHAYLDELIARRQSERATGTIVPDDMVTRLVRLQDETGLSDEGVRRNLGGVIVGAVDTTSKATAHAVDQLLAHPRALHQARAAAVAGDVEQVGQWAFEALRFNPINPVLSRHVARDTVLAAGTRRRRRIPGGCTLYTGILPAMFDPEVFPDPGQLRGDRPLASYLHFGHGLHRCFGRFVNVIQIPELVAAVLRLEGLRRAPGRRGAIVYDGPFPDRLLVDFDTGAGAGAVPPAAPPRLATAP
ncbi:MAG TPA: cytochrome P450 [Acidimicrobiales bacterium]|nr:cytochrome P450 [Acidimicrobiales bacterium]